ncbi:hypothetical protein Glove_606g8 [Diversispora epigaea]|uniref:FAR1 domain-containing protein n=1 Tax=Diversispora epigaea TaxID=1348612 RepID=A0A397G6V6_9GLOM|nr:hypothetical protein Glove_606g8 [Diversispora epigaea]
MLRKEVYMKESCNAEHNTDNCQFRINAYHRKNDNLVYITKVENQHNHKLVNAITTLVLSYQKFTSEMQDNIKLLAIYSPLLKTLLREQHPSPHRHNSKTKNPHPLTKGDTHNCELRVMILLPVS